MPVQIRTAAGTLIQNAVSDKNIVKMLKKIKKIMMIFMREGLTL